jgi:hypothetical protein
MLYISKIVTEFGNHANNFSFTVNQNKTSTLGHLRDIMPTITLNSTEGNLEVSTSDYEYFYGKTVLGYLSRTGGGKKEFYYCTINKDCLCFYPFYVSSLAKASFGNEVVVARNWIVIADEFVQDDSGEDTHIINLLPELLGNMSVEQYTKMLDRGNFFVKCNGRENHLHIRFSQEFLDYLKKRSGQSLDMHAVWHLYTKKKVISRV